MDQALLHKLLSLYISGKGTEEERRLVEHWYELIGEPLEPNMTAEQWLLLEAKMWQRLQPTPVHTQPGMTIPLWRRLAVAVSTIAAMAIIVFGVYRHRQSQSFVPRDVALTTEGKQKDWIQYSNHDSQAKKIYLPDNSQVSLEPRSMLAISPSFNVDGREVHLTGEAVFDVERNPSLPFIVYSGTMAARVLGTRFRVKAAQSGKPIEVAVLSGKVTVYSSAPKSEPETPASNGLILTPNQKATYFPDTDQFVAGLTDKPEPIQVPSERDMKEMTFAFEETPMNHIAKLLEDLYGIEIELEQEAFENCPFTGNLTHQSLFEKLDLLCGAINGKYEVRGTKILITGKGCK